ncbi:PEP-CTERM sorting domain-containing protein [Phenylobacterium sp.]|uniref:PEP-CTERM sorting domain-containing protein n=1 Tax=Phenylobacterium sp. TaxID=1871053 RepID=UPI0035ADAE40
MFRILAPVALAAALVLPAAAQADTYTSANFSAGAFGGGANVSAPFLGVDIYPGASFSGNLVFDNDLVPAAGSGFVNVFYSDFPDIGAIPAGDAFTLNFGSKTFTLADANPGSAAIQYNNGKFNGFFYVSDFLWSGAWYQLNIQGGSLSVYALDGQKNPILGKSYVNGYVNIGNTGLTNQQPYGIPSAGVPEPGTWAMMLIGFFGAGFAVRRGRRALVLARA